MTLLSRPAVAGGEQAASGSDTVVERGHSAHGAAFDEGPRQQARIETGVGNVHFPITTSKPEAQRFFDQGINQLYSFSYFESERSFRQAAMLDPDCAMAYWGMARADQSDRRKAFLALARAKMAKATDRERRYIEAESLLVADNRTTQRQHEIEYVQALENLVLAYPDDLEAKLLLERALPDEADGKSNRIPKDALLHEVLARNPNHPGAHHFRIHLWDGKNGAAALDSCKAYPLLAPNIGHAQHMPGHIYAQLGMWPEAVDAMDRAARVERRYFYDRKQMPFDSWNYAHDQHYLVANLGYLGRITEGVRLAQELIDSPRDPKANSDGEWQLVGQGRFAMLRMRVRGERWDDILNDPNNSGWSDVGNEGGWKLYALGLAYLGKGDIEKARLQSRMMDAMKGISNEIECARLELRGRIAVTTGDFTSGLEALQRAEEIEKTRFSENDPPPYPRPVYEALGWGYIEAKKWEEAESALNDGLKRDPNNGFALALLIQAQRSAGNRTAAQQAAALLAKSWRWADPDLPALHRLLAAYPDIKPFSTPFHPGPALEQLGPAEWRPFPAADFALSDPDGKTVRLADFRGHNVLIVFTLGSTCKSCMKALDVIGKEKAAFDALDTRLVVMNADSPASNQTLLKSGAPPFLFLSDTSGSVRRAYKAYDEFEKLDLHAAILVDREGRTWWFRAGGDPFDDVAFLKTEVARMADWTHKHSNLQTARR
jgi:peroxiredoxin